MKFQETWYDMEHSGDVEREERIYRKAGATNVRVVRGQAHEDDETVVVEVTIPDTMTTRQLYDNIEAYYDQLDAEQGSRGR